MIASSPVWDIHAHYLPLEAIGLMGSGLVEARLEVVGGVADSITINGMPVGATIHQLSDVDGIVAATDRAGIDVRVLSPPPFTYRYWDSTERSLALCRLLNDSTAEVVRSHPNRFRGLATVPLQDTSAAIGELQRARGELGLVGVTVGTNVAGANVSDGGRRSFLREAAYTGMPVLVHPDFVPTARLDNYYLINLIGLPTETTIAMGNMIFSGLFEELPELRVCFMHGGGGAPALFGRWDVGWRVRTESRVDIARPPTNYLNNIYCDTLTHSPLALTHLVEVMGAENVVIGTDTPFDVEDPGPLQHLQAAPRLTDKQRHVIMSESPLRWLNGIPPR